MYIYMYIYICVYIYIYMYIWKTGNITTYGCVMGINVNKSLKQKHKMV